MNCRGARAYATHSLTCAAGKVVRTRQPSREAPRCAWVSISLLLMAVDGTADSESTSVMLTACGKTMKYAFGGMWLGQREQIGVSQAALTTVESQASPVWLVTASAPAAAHPLSPGRMDLLHSSCYIWSPTPRCTFGHTPRQLCCRTNPSGRYQRTRPQRPKETPDDIQTTELEGRCASFLGSITEEWTIASHSAAADSVPGANEGTATDDQATSEVHAISTIVLYLVWGNSFSANARAAEVARSDMHTCCELCVELGPRQCSDAALNRTCYSDRNTHLMISRALFCNRRKRSKRNDVHGRMNSCLGKLQLSKDATRGLPLSSLSQHNFPCT